MNGLIVVYAPMPSWRWVVQAWAFWTQMAPRQLLKVQTAALHWKLKAFDTVGSLAKAHNVPRNALATTVDGCNEDIQKGQLFYCRKWREFGVAIPVRSKNG